MRFKFIFKQKAIGKNLYVQGFKVWTRDGATFEINMDDLETKISSFELPENDYFRSASVSESIQPNSNLIQCIRFDYAMRFHASKISTLMNYEKYQVTRILKYPYYF